MLGDLSAKYESNGDPATVSGGEGDGGGVSYGAYQFSSANGVPQRFVEWAKKYPDANLANYGIVLAEFEVGSQEFNDEWASIGNTDPVGFLKLQHEFTKESYYDGGATNLLNWYLFDINERSDALRNVLWSSCVQFGTFWGTKNFRESADLLGKSIGDCTDEELIYGIYEVRLTDMSYSSGSPSLREGLFSRWRNEREDALAML